VYYNPLSVKLTLVQKPQVWSIKMSLTRRSLTGMLGSLLVIMPISGIQAGTPIFSDREIDTHNIWSSLKLIDVQGNILFPANPPKRFLLLNMWANWCAACLSELDAFSSLIEHLGADKVDIVLVSHPSNWTADLVYAKKHNIGLPMYTFDSPASSEQIATLFGTDGTSYSVPRSIVFRKGGYAPVMTVEGTEDWDSNEMAQAIDNAR
jgi:thiol-disulfide isomerase/thioredoxin